MLYVLHRRVTFRAFSAEVDAFGERKREKAKNHSAG
jgi:hypothetical protein